LDVTSESRLFQVHVRLAGAVRAMAGSLIEQGIEIRVVQGLRTVAEQNALYAQGRTAPGKIVTNAPGGHSWHEFGLAVDCVPGVRGAAKWTPNWDPKHPDYAAMAACGEQQGLVSGSRWTHIPDWPHFQLGGIPVSPDDEARELLAAQGVNGFWRVYLDPLS
jgi:peptidoglycan L-alanyl-D-glutamate endopeptidase CwlK